MKELTIVFGFEQFNSFIYKSLGSSTYVCNYPKFIIELQKGPADISRN